MMNSSDASILVLGSLNIDRIWLVAALPLPGETITARGTRREFGGKGANQAVAAARLGARVSFAGAVGNEADGHEYLAHLKTAGIDVRFVRAVDRVATGSASIYVDAQGENAIVIDGGANQQFRAEDARTAILATNPALLVSQFEIPADTLVSALTLCAERGIPVLLNPSPVREAFPWGRFPIHTLVVNESEAMAYFERTPEDLWALDSVRITPLLESRRVQHLIVTRGAEDTLFFSATEKLRVPALPVTPVDTVGAGDTFAGILAAQIVAGKDWPTALRHANTGAALATQKRGAQTAMPTSAELTAALG